MRKKRTFCFDIYIIHFNCCHQFIHSIKFQKHRYTHTHTYTDFVMLCLCEWQMILNFPSFPFDNWNHSIRMHWQFLTAFPIQQNLDYYFLSKNTSVCVCVSLSFSSFGVWRFRELKHEEISKQFFFAAAM